MRLGDYECLLKKGSRVEKLYTEYNIDKTPNIELKISERHRHRFEFNNNYKTEFEKHGFIISGTSPDGNLVEMVELANHPFMLATQAHPELISRPTHPHPLMM